MTITHKLKIDLMRQEIYPPVSVVQGDTYSREVAISLYSGGSPWELPNGHEIAIRYSKPDGTTGIYDTLPDDSVAWSTDGNTVSVVLCPQMLTCPGKVSAQVIIIVGERILATFPFTVAVAPDPSAGTVRSEPYYNWRNAFLPQTEGAKVGQFLQISKVDASGRIIEVVAVENPAGAVASAAADALRIAQEVEQEMKDYSPSGTRSIAESAMRTASSRLVAPESASVGQYFRAAAVDANGIVTAVEAVDAPSGVNGGMTTAQINALHGMFKVCLFDDTKDVDGAISAFETVFGITDSGGDTGGGEDSGGEDSGGTTADALPTNGLMAYFDLRNLGDKANVTVGTTKGVMATQGSGALFSWTDQPITSSDNYGIKTPRTMMFSAEGNTTQTDLGTEFTVISFGFGECIGPGIQVTNINPRWQFMPSYNKADGTAKADITYGSALNGDSMADYNFAVYRVSGANLTLINDSSRKVYNGNDYEGFVYWDSKPFLGRTHFGKGYGTAVAIYNRALTDVEIEEARAFMKTLEVTA